MVYSLGTYTRETETVRWSSISFTSFRASSIGCTCVRKARPKTPSKRPSIFDSIVRNTLMGPRGIPLVASLDGSGARSGGDGPCERPHEGDPQQRDEAGAHCDGPDEERCSDREHAVARTPPRER